MFFFLIVTPFEEKSIFFCNFSVLTYKFAFFKKVAFRRTLITFEILESARSSKVLGLCPYDGACARKRDEPDIR